MADDDRFLSRWSRLKRQYRASSDLGPAPMVPAVTAAGGESDEANETRSAGEPLPVTTGAGGEGGKETAVTLPSLESLTYESDFSPFMSSKVSDSVRNMALRRLWRSNPVLANLDGLNDYDDDYSDAATVISGMKSAYRAGLGYLAEKPKSDEENHELVLGPDDPAASDSAPVTEQPAIVECVDDEDEAPVRIHSKDGDFSPA